MKYLIIDEHYRVYKADVLSGAMRAALKRGELTIIDVKNEQGMDLDGWTFSPVQEWQHEFAGTTHEPPFNENAMQLN